MKKLEIKICGITSLKDAQMLEKYNPDYLGFVFHKPSSRNINIETLEDISEYIHDINEQKKRSKKNIQCVGVFVNPSLEFLEKVSIFLDVFQFHGEETPEFCKKMQNKFPHKRIWKALRISDLHQLKKIKNYDFLETILIDSFSKHAHGGTGKILDKRIIKEVKNYIGKSQKFFIAGGINVMNKKEIITSSQADGIDVSSSLEKKNGEKDEKKVKEFFLED